jgi:hypothetical protein
MRAPLLIAACALLGMSNLACSALSKPDEIRVFKDIPLPPVQIAAPEQQQPIALPAGLRGAPGAPGAGPKKGG